MKREEREERKRRREKKIGREKGNQTNSRLYSNEKFHFFQNIVY